MDAVDRKLLAALLTNSRASLTKLGKSAGLSRESTHYRIQRLVKNKVIRSFVTRIDYQRLGFEHFTLFVQYGTMTEEHERALLHALRSHSAFSWIGIIAGKSSLTVDVYAHSPQEANTIVAAVMKRFTKHIANYAVLHNKSDMFFFEKLVGRKFVATEMSHERHFIDTIDKTILRALADDSRSSYVYLGTKTGLTANAIKKRIRTLEHSGVIQGYGVSLDHRALGFEWDGLQIQGTVLGEKTRQRIMTFCREHPYVLFLYEYSAGAHAYDIGVIVKDSHELRAFINEFRTRFSDIFAITDVFLVLEESTSHSLPPAVFAPERA